MPDWLESDVTEIEGIGPATAAKLAEAGVALVGDLLQVPAGRLHRAVSDVVSSAQVAAWQRMAFMLTVRHVTPQWAEALVRSGVDTSEKLAARDLDELTTLLANARGEGVIPDVPTPLQSAAMIADAAVVSHTGVIAGLVVDGNEAPVAGATVRRGGRETITGPGGRFRLDRLRLGVTLPLTIEHPAHLALRIEDPAVAVVPDTVVGERFVLHAGTPAPPAMRSELDGDEIPLAGGMDVRERLVDADPPEGALLMVRRRYERFDAAKLISRLLVAEGDVVYVNTYRIPYDRLPDGVDRGDHFMFKGGRFEPVDITAEGVRRYRIKRRLRAALAGRARDASLIDDEIAFLTEAGYFRGSRNAR